VIQLDPAAQPALRHADLGADILQTEPFLQPYAWAERAKAAGYPERYAQVNLGHNSKAMTRAYSRKAEVEMPSLSEYERQQKAIIAGHETEPVTQSVAA